MFILAVKGYEEDGAFSIENDDGDRVLLMFEEEDAVSYTHLTLPTKLTV